MTNESANHKGWLRQTVRFGIVTAILAAGGCADERVSTDEPVQLTSADRELMKRAPVTDSVMRMAKRIGPVEGWIALDSLGEEYDAPGLLITVDEARAKAALQDLREVFTEQGSGLYWAERHFGFAPDRLVVVPNTDPYAFLAIVRTDGINYDLEHEAVIAQLRRWDEAFGLSYVGASLDWVEAEIVTLPEDLQAFAQAVYAFCPDVVDQGTETLDALVRELRRRRTLYCWWD